MAPGNLDFLLLLWSIVAFSLSQLSNPFLPIIYYHSWWTKIFRKPSTSSNFYFRPRITYPFIHHTRDGWNLRQQMPAQTNIAWLTIADMAIISLAHSQLLITYEPLLHKLHAQHPLCLLNKVNLVSSYRQTRLHQFLIWKKLNDNLSVVAFTNNFIVVAYIYTSYKSTLPE